MNMDEMCVNLFRLQFRLNSVFCESKFQTKQSNIPGSVVYLFKPTTLGRFFTIGAEISFAILLVSPPCK